MCCVQSQLDKDTSDTSSSSVDSDDEMPLLFPVTDVVPTSPVSTVRDPSTSVTAAVTVQRSSTTADRSVSRCSVKSTTHDVSHTQLYCICHTPYDETRYRLLLVHFHCKDKL